MAACRSGGARTTRPALGALPTPGHGPGTPGRPRTGGDVARSGTLPVPPGDLVTCGAHAGPGRCARPALRRAAHSAASRLVVQAQDHGPSAAVPAGVVRGSHWGPSLLTCGRPHAPSSQMRCWGPMVGVRRGRRRVAWFMLALPTATPSPGAAVGHTTNGCARAAERGAWALRGAPTPGGCALRARVRTSSGASNPVRGGVSRR